MPILPVAPVSRLIREAGAKRVSEGARDALAEVLERAMAWRWLGRQQAGRPCKRKTVKAEDIKEAVKRVKPLRF